MVNFYQNFKPWENESLELNVSRTIPQKGVNLTIESSKLIINQSNSYRDLNLEIKNKKCYNSLLSSSY